MIGARLIAVVFITMKRDIVASIIFFVLVGGLLSLPAGNTNSLSGSVRDVFAVPQIGLQRAKEWFRSAFREKAELAEENKRLRFEIEELRNQIRQNKSLQDEVQELRALLNLKSSSDYRLLAAQLISRDVNGWWQIARIDKGVDDGITADLPVIDREGLVGHTVNVSRNTSDVLFLTSSRIKIAARLARSEIFGIVRGQGVSWLGDAKCRMDFIMKGADINRADEIVTSGLGGVYPAGLVIGYVENVQTDPSGLFQYAEVIPAADFTALDVVFIVLSDKNESALKQVERKKKQR